MRFHPSTCVPILLILLFSVNSRAGESIFLSQYLDQVKAKNQGYLSAVRAAKGAGNSASSAYLLFSPQLYWSGMTALDKSPTTDPQTYGNQRANDEYQAGIKSQTPFGQQLQIAWKNDRYKIDGSLLPISEYYQNAFSFQLSQDLFRNFFGIEARAEKEQIKALSLSGSYNASYAAKYLLVQAESLYWSLSIAREVVKSREDALDRSNDLLNWMASRVNRKLGDKSDLLQAKSDQQYKTMLLATAKEDERAISRTFNLMRGMDADLVSEELDLPSDKEFAVPVFSTNIPVSDDLRAKEWEAKANMKSAFLRSQSTMPVLSAFFQGSLNGLDKTRDKAMTQSTKTSNSTYAVGINLNIPLDIFSAHKARTGFREQEDAYKLKLEQDKLKHISDRKDLVQSIKDRAERLKMARAMEATQKEKADYERDRLRRGTTITAQVIQFDQDLVQSHLARAGIQIELLSLLAKLKLYDEEGTSK